MKVERGLSQQGIIRYKLSVSNWKNSVENCGYISNGWHSYNETFRYSVFGLFLPHFSTIWF